MKRVLNESCRFLPSIIKHMQKAYENTVSKLYILHTETRINFQILSKRYYDFLKLEVMLKVLVIWLKLFNLKTKQTFSETFTSLAFMVVTALKNENFRALKSLKTTIVPLYWIPILQYIVVVLTRLQYFYLKSVGFFSNRT